jgi:PKD repeat protein
MGDGYVFTDVTPAKYTYAKGGTYTITVTVTGDKGSVKTVKKIVKAEKATATVSPTIIICNVTTPMGGGARDIGVICDGKMPTSAGSQYDTYILGDPHGNPETKVTYIGYLYDSAKIVSQVVFTEGGHFGNGGWFKNGTLTVQVLQNGKWVDAECDVTPAYPAGNNGKQYETFTFKLKTPVSCDGVRLYGIAGGCSGFISVGELEVK